LYGIPATLALQCFTHSIAAIRTALPHGGERPNIVRAKPGSRERLLKPLARPRRSVERPGVHRSRTPH